MVAVESVYIYKFKVQVGENFVGASNDLEKVKALRKVNLFI